jgi:hypothetical protein
LGFSPISHDVSRTIKIFDGLVCLNGASLKGDATTDQAEAANDMAGSVVARLISDNGEMT